MTQPKCGNPKCINGILTLEFLDHVESFPCPTCSSTAVESELQAALTLKLGPKKPQASKPPRYTQHQDWCHYWAESVCNCQEARAEGPYKVKERTPQEVTGPGVETCFLDKDDSKEVAELLNIAYKSARLPLLARVKELEEALEEHWKVCWKAVSRVLDAEGEKKS